MYTDADLAEFIETGNVKLVQKALNHADIRTTSKYAHVLTDEIAAAMERVTESRKSPETSSARPVN
jgi:site-specific recombinase XerD